MAALYPATTQFPSTTLFPQGPDGPVLLAHLGFEDPTTDDGNRDWFNVTDRLRGEATVTRGRASELDTVEPAVASALFENRDSELSPENTAGAHYGDLVPMRRLWLRSQWADETQDLFKGYVEGFDPDWPEAGFDNVCRVTATDGSKVLNLWKLEAPETTGKPYRIYGTSFIRVRDAYGIRVLDDGPWAYWRLGKSPQGSKLFDSSGQGHSGIYINTPTLGADPLIQGTSDKAVTFASASTEYARMETTDFPTETVTVELWYKPTSLPGADDHDLFVAGQDSGGSLSACRVFVEDADDKVTAAFSSGGTIVGLNSTTVLEVGKTYHIVATYSATAADLYINGAAEDTVAGPHGALSAATSQISIASGWAIAGTAVRPANGTFDEVAIYDKVLTAGQAADHFAIGSLGFDEHASGTRISEALDQVAYTVGDLTRYIFATRTLHAGERELLAVAFASGSALDVIQQAVYSEGIPALFYLDRSGNPVFLDRGYRSDAPYTTTQVTFGQAASEVPYLHLDIATGDGFLYNEVRTGRDEEDAVPQVVEDATSKGRYLTRVYEKTGMICTTDANALTEANTLLAQLKDPFTRVTSVDVALTDLLGTISSRHAINRLLSLELGEKVVVKREDRYGATTLSQTSYVEADELRMAAGAAGWTMRLGVSPR